MSNVKYREVKRVASVGERIKIVKSDPRDYRHKNGDVGEVITSGALGVFAKFDGSTYGTHGVWTSEYVVLEPVAGTAPTDTLAESFRQFVLANADAIRAILPALETQLSAEPPVKVPAPRKLKRAEVIAKASADVAELLRIGNSCSARLPRTSPLHNDFFKAEFIVNREKRTVVALLSPQYGRGFHLAGGYVEAPLRGIAKAAPDDVFHAEIGKAIALRRALGLAVPDEYVNAPNPDEPRVGAVVQRINEVPDSGRVGKVTAMRPDGFRDHARGLVAEGFPGTGWSYIDRVIIIDDTDVDYSAVSVKEAA